MCLNMCLVLFLHMVVMVDISQGSQCYNCTSLRDPNCGDPFNSTGVMKTTCTTRDSTPGDHDHSRSVCFKEKAEVDGRWEYERRCARDGKDGFFADTCALTGNLTYKEYCICGSDLCNPAARARSRALIVSYLLITYILLV